ncbi:hypothetical protein LCGC14_2664670, partial [marine sediment metagenome]
GSPYQKKGTPDLLVVAHNGKPCFFEIKQPGKHPTKLQQHRLELLQKRKITAEVVHSWAEVSAVLAEVIHKT